MLAAEYAAVLDHLQGEKDRLAAATAAANTSSSSSATNQRQQQLHQPQPRDAAGSSLQQQEPGGSSSGGGRGNGKAVAQELQQQQERAGMPGNSPLPRVQAGDQQPAPPAAASRAGTTRAAEEASGSASTSSSRQGDAGTAAAGAAAAVGQQESSGAAVLCPRPALVESLLDGEKQQQGLHTSSRWASVVGCVCGNVCQFDGASRLPGCCGMQQCHFKGDAHTGMRLEAAAAGEQKAGCARCIQSTGGHVTAVWCSGLMPVAGMGGWQGVLASRFMKAEWVGGHLQHPCVSCINGADPPTCQVQWLA